VRVQNRQMFQVNLGFINSKKITKVNQNTREGG